MQGSQMLIRKTRLTLLAFLLGAALVVAPLPESEHAGPGIAGATLEAPPKPPPPEEPAYNPEYLFATTRTVAYSTLPIALKTPLFVLTIPVDLALLPVAAVAGFF